MRSTLRCDVCGRAIEGTALGETGSFGMKVWHPGCKPATHQAAEGALTDEQIPDVLQAVDEVARAYDVYEYGLPLGFDDEDRHPQADLIDAFRAALPTAQGQAADTPRLSRNHNGDVLLVLGKRTWLLHEVEGYKTMEPLMRRT